MIGYSPRRPDGSDSESRFHQHTYDAAQRTVLTPAPGVRVNRTTRGVSVVPVRQRVSALSNESATQYFKTLGGTGSPYISADLIGCHTYDPAHVPPVEGTETIWIALSPLTAATYHPDGENGNTIVYDPADPQHRTVTMPDGTVLEEYWTPGPLVAGQIIEAKPARTGFKVGGVDVVWQMNGAPYWAWDPNATVY